MPHQKYLGLKPDLFSPHEILLADLGLPDLAAEVKDNLLEPVLVDGGGVVGDPGQAPKDLGSHDLGDRGESTGRKFQNVMQGHHGEASLARLFTKEKLNAEVKF